MGLLSGSSKHDHPQKICSKLDKNLTISTMTQTIQRDNVPKKGLVLGKKSFPIKFNFEESYQNGTAVGWGEKCLQSWGGFEQELPSAAGTSLFSS